MKRNMHAITGMLCLALSLTGCVAGYNSLLFVTKTNIGLEVDTQPPTFSLDIGRQEGLLAPSYEAGKTPPVLASFRFENQDAFSNYIGSAFATGDAAVAMARLYDAEDNEAFADDKIWDLDRDDWAELEEHFDSAVMLEMEPKLPFFVPKSEPHRVRPVLFGTDTSTGFKVKWSGVQGTMPDYIRLSYQRRELAFAAVTVGPEITRNEETGEREVKGLSAATPSLLATVDADFSATTRLSTKVGYLQYFASGSAATALAMRNDVRQAMTRRLDPDQAARMNQPKASTEFDTEGENLELRVRFQAWWSDTTTVVVATLKTQATAAKAALAAASPKTDELKKNEAITLYRWQAAKNIEKGTEDTLAAIPTEGAVRQDSLAMWLEDQGIEAEPSLWIRGKDREKMQEAIQYFSIP